jgi:hypothetical protein
MDGFDSLTMKVGEYVAVFHLDGVLGLRTGRIENITPEGVVDVKVRGQPVTRFNRDGSMHGEINGYGVPCIHYMTDRLRTEIASRLAGAALNGQKQIPQLPT